MYERRFQAVDDPLQPARIEKRARPGGPPCRPVDVLCARPLDPRAEIAPGRRGHDDTPAARHLVGDDVRDVAGHSAIGRGFHELLIGVNAGRQLGPILPNVYLHGRYSYTILKRFEGMNLNRSNVDWEVGWLATGKLTLRFLGAWQKSYGGLNLPVDLHSEEDHEIHDRAARADFVRLGGGATFSVNRSFDIDIAYATTVWGRNIHAVGGMALGFSWRFSRGHDISKISAKNSPRSIPIAEQALF